MKSISSSKALKTLNKYHQDMHNLLLTYPKVIDEDEFDEDMRLAESKIEEMYVITKRLIKKHWG